MIPLDQLLAFDITSSIGDVIDHSFMTGHRRFPVYESEKSNLTQIAIITNRDLLASRYS